MSEHVNSPPTERYIKPSELAKILGWKRPNVYYWLNRCQVPMVELAGYKLIPVNDLPRLVLMLKTAKEQARQRRFGDG